MAIVLVGEALTQSADNTAHTIDVGTPSDGDFMLMLAVADSGFGTGLTAPTGWTPLVENEIAAITGSSSARWLLCYKFAGASETDPSITLSAAQEVVASVARFTGVDTSVPIDVAVSYTNHAGTQNNGIAPDILTVTNGAVWVAGLVNDDDRENRTGGAGMSLIRSAASNDAATGNGVGLHWRYEEVATAGQTGTETFNLTAAEECEAFSVALRPASGGNTYSITADQGSYTLTGQVATFLAPTEILNAEFGTYSLLGSEGAVDVEMNADQGAYALSGQVADIENPKTLTAVQGAYALTGQNATLSYSGAVIAAVEYIVRNVRRVMRRGWANFGRY
jgi:hypothetical protein